MKGLIFTELLSMVESKFGEDFTEDLIMSLDLKSGAAYLPLDPDYPNDLLMLDSFGNTEGVIPISPKLKAFLENIHFLAQVLRYE